MDWPNRSLLERWLILLAVIAAVWPGLFFFVEFFGDNHLMYDDANELDAFALIFSPMPIALLVMAFARARRQIDCSIILGTAGMMGLVLTIVRPAWSAFRNGFGASSDEDVDYLERDKIAIWTGVLLVLWLVLVAVDAGVHLVLRRRLA
jgi:hypothetical protein